MSKRPTQRERVYRLLLQAGERGVETGEFLADHLPRFAARINELRDRGWDIRTEKLSQSSYRYTLVGTKLDGRASRMRPRRALELIAEGVPVKDEWRSAPSFMESVAVILDQAGIERPDHYRE